MSETVKTNLWVLFWISFVILLITSWMRFYPPYSVWKSDLTGKAELARATQARQIQVEQAKAEELAATHTAAAIKILGKAAQDYPEYREQMFIQGFAEALQQGKIDSIVYVPTEAMIPIMEAGQRP